MKKFFFSHPDITLAAIACVLLGSLIAFFVWGINDVVFEVQQSTGSPQTAVKQGFDLQDAGTLGLPTGTSVPPAAPATPSNPPATPTSTATTTPSSTKR